MGEWRCGVLLDLEITVVSAKQLKNVNWRNGGVLKPYAVAYLDPDRRAATKVDHDGSTRPVWNEKLTLPIPSSSSSSSSSFQQQTGDQDRYQDEDDALFLTLDVFHSKPSETPKPLVGTVRVPLKEVLQQQQPRQRQRQRQEDSSSSSSSSVIKTLQLQRPSGRPQGKLRIKVVLRDRPNLPNQPQYQYQNTLPPISPSYYYSSTSTAPQSLSGSTRPSSGEDYRHLTFSPPSPYPSSPPLPITTPPPPTLYSNPNLMPSPFPPPPPHTSYYNYPSAYSDPYLTTAPSPAAYYSAAPPALSPPLSYYGRPGSTYYGPSAPADYSLRPHCPSSSSSSRLGITGTGLAVGALAGSLKGLTLEQGIKKNHEEEQEEEDNITAAAERVESNLQTARDDYTHHMPATNYKSYRTGP